MQIEKISLWHKNMWFEINIENCTDKEQNYIGEYVNKKYNVCPVLKSSVYGKAIMKFIKVKGITK
jgi:hypothetical protein